MNHFYSCLREEVPAEKKLPSFAANRLIISTYHNFVGHQGVTRTREKGCWGTLSKTGAIISTWKQENVLSLVRYTSMSMASSLSVMEKNRRQEAKRSTLPCQTDPISGPLSKGASSIPIPGDPYREEMAAGSDGLEYGWEHVIPCLFM